jgi:hypothetical protein
MPMRREEGEEELGPTVSGALPREDRPRLAVRLRAVGTGAPRIGRETKSPTPLHQRRAKEDATDDDHVTS